MLLLLLITRRRKKKEKKPAANVHFSMDMTTRGKHMSFPSVWPVLHSLHTLVTPVGVVRVTPYQPDVNQQQGRTVVSPVSLLRMQRQRARVVVASSLDSRYRRSQIQMHLLNLVIGLHSGPSGAPRCLSDSGCHRKP